jgi:Ankyrin repeats (many copies)
VAVARTLIVLGADLTARNGNGDTPLHLVLSLLTRTSINFYFTSWWREVVAGILMILLEHGANVNAQNADGWTPYHLASQGGLGGLTSLLLEHGADPSETPAPKPASDSPPVTSPSPTTFDFADTDLPRTPSPLYQESQPPPNESEVATFEHNRHPVSYSRLFLFSLGFVAIAVVLPFFIRSVPQKFAVGRGT